MDIQRDVVVEEETGADEAQELNGRRGLFHEPAFHTFLVAASVMPRFSASEISGQLGDRWQRGAARVFSRVAAKARENA